MAERQPRPRIPFTVLDLMLLVAGTAVGYAAVVRVEGLAEEGPIGQAILMGLGAFLGLVLAGPAVMLRAYRLTGRAPEYTGQWLWLICWPSALLALLGLALNVRMLRDLALLVYILWALALSAGVALHISQAPARAPGHSRRGLGFWGVASASVYLAVAVLLPPALLAVLPGWILWGALEAYSSQVREPTRERPPWTHWFGLILLTAPAVLFLATAAILHLLGYP